MSDELVYHLSGEVIEERELTLEELCQLCSLPTETLLELVAEGVLEPIGAEPQQWYFTGVSVRRVRIATTLRRDLGVNLAGAALVLDLLDELQQLRTRVGST